MLNILRTIREQIKYLPARIFNFHSKSNKKDIFIFSSPRSGSTWLMELIASQKNIKYVDEPLHINRHKSYLTNIEPSWSFIYSDSNREGKFVNYLDKILKNKLFLGQQKFKHILQGEFDYFTNRKAFKILRAKDLINVFEMKFNIQVVYLLRHPIPVALSLIRENIEHRVVHYLNNDLYCQKYLSEELICFSNQIIEHGSELEIRILQWCLENLPPIKFFIKENWVIVTYEDLVVNGEETINKLYNSLNLNEFQSLAEHLSQPSRTTEDIKTKNKIINEDKTYLIRKWEKVITKEEKQKAFDILRKFDLEKYIKQNYFVKIPE